MKKLIIIRGAPSTGKTRLAQKIKEEEGAIVFNNDTLIEINGIYKWNEELALQAHCENQKLLMQSMRKGDELLVLDNTNVSPYECIPHIRLAKYYGYQYKVIETSKLIDIKELEKRNKHNVPASVIEEMLKILNSVPLSSFCFILDCEEKYDPEISLRQAQLYTERCSYIKADECMIDYADWCRVGGFIPAGGSDVAESINEKLLDWRISQGTAA